MRRRAGFSLLEVLVALGLATMVLGVLLSSAGSQTLRISRMEPRYRALLAASSVLEKAANEKFTGNEEGVTGEDERQATDLDGVVEDTAAPEGFRYELTTHSVPADPRIEQLHVEVEGSRHVRAILNAYRLRKQRQDPAASPSPAP